MKIAVYRYLVTLIVVAVAAGAAWFLYQKYVTDPWTRDCQVRANIVGIAPRVSGPIINIPVHDNQEVKAGDLLFEIDPADYKTALDSAKASVANAEANVLQKKQDLDRETDLFQRKVSSKQEFQNAQNAIASAEAQLKAAQANLQQSELNLGYTKVYAPLDGYLTNVNTSPGAYVHTGDQLLALVDSSSFWIAAYFKETQLLSIKPGRTVKITLMGYHDEPFEGKNRQCRLGHLCAGRFWRNVERPACGGQPNRRLGSTPPTVPCPSPNHWQTSNSSQDRPDSYSCGTSKGFADTREPFQATLTSIA